MKKTIAIGIIALQHQGELLKRFVGEIGVLPGTMVMVPQDCWCVLVAGDRATTIFDVGPHELQLRQFNRQPAGFLFTVGKAPFTITWYPQGSPFQRSMVVKVKDPLLFVTEMVVKRFADTEENITGLLRQNLDALVPPGQIIASGEEAENVLAEALQHVGLSLQDVRETPAVAAPPVASPPMASASPPMASPAPPMASPPMASPAAPVASLAPDSALSPSPMVSGASPAASPAGLSLRLFQVWSSSTMELFGKGELTLRVRVLGRAESAYNPAGPFTYDETREFLSPDNWLGERVWQSLPEDTLVFVGLRGDHFYRVFIVAEERDRSSVDPLGTLEWEIGPPRAGELEMGPTQGGKRGHYVKLMARVG